MHRRQQQNLYALLTIVVVASAGFVMLLPLTRLFAQAGHTYQQSAPTIGGLVTATPLTSDGTWQGKNDQVEIELRVSGSVVEVVVIRYHYGDSFACGASDPAFRQIEVYHQNEGNLLSLERTSFSGVVPASYTIAGQPITGGTLAITGTFQPELSAVDGTISFTPAAGPVLHGGSSCLEQRSDIPWSAVQIVIISPTATNAATPSTALIAPVLTTAAPPTPTSTPPPPQSVRGWPFYTAITVILVLLIWIFYWIRNRHISPNSSQHRSGAASVTRSELNGLYRQLDIYIGNLNHLNQQAAIYGGEMLAPLPLKNQLDSARKQIADLHKRIAELEGQLK